SPVRWPARSAAQAAAAAWSAWSTPIGAPTSRPRSAMRARACSRSRSNRTASSSRKADAVDTRQRPRAHMILSPQDIHGLDTRTGRPVRVRVASSIEQVDELPDERQTTDGTYVAPGWIDLQVNGFAGVDYNDPAASQEAIARSMETMVSTGVTRCYPTVITGAPDAMNAAIVNLAQ